MPVEKPLTASTSAPSIGESTVTSCWRTARSGEPHIEKITVNPALPGIIAKQPPAKNESEPINASIAPNIASNVVRIHANIIGVTVTKNAPGIEPKMPNTEPKPKNNMPSRFDPDTLIETWRALAAQMPQGDGKDRLLRLADQLELSPWRACFGSEASPTQTRQITTPADDDPPKPKTRKTHQ
jgi:hypothetical protein